MADEEYQEKKRPSALDVVALLADVPNSKLVRGQVGTVVQELDRSTALVEFSDNSGRAYAITSLHHTDLLVLRYLPQT